MAGFPQEHGALAVQEADAACRAAIYVRLSVEDTHTHSVSIETQQMIIARYLEQYPEISVYDTYIDNGATGTNFHRPGFQQMLSDIEAGHVNCVIVKDLSRLGRNTIDTGYYIEQYFRIRNIRFIAVNENFDTAAPEDAHSGIIIPLRNMINEAYALDIGRKIRAQQRQAMKDGKFIGARTPYGYLKAEDDCHQLIIDPVAAVVVQRMFRWASEGAGLNTIAVRLNEAGILIGNDDFHTLIAGLVDLGKVPMQRSACEQVCIENRTMFFQIIAAHTPVLADLVFWFVRQRKVWDKIIALLTVSAAHFFK